ncbi:hypothetical protein HDU97_001250 [Phlyctochytrium planicorne]|nr:hypothetical protein HDU97_001250 [Phlyctochytrium planicorne]
MLRSSLCMSNHAMKLSAAAPAAVSALASLNKRLPHMNAIAARKPRSLFSPAVILHARSFNSVMPPSPSPATLSPYHSMMEGIEGIPVRRKETELKLRLKSSEDLEKVEQALERREMGAGFRCFKYFDRFFDGNERQFWNHNKSTLRLRQTTWLPSRHTEHDQQSSPRPAANYVVTIKTSGSVQDGIYRAFEEDIEIDTRLAEAIIHNPQNPQLWCHQHPFLASLVDRYNLKGGLKPLASLTSVRTRFGFDGGFVDLDEISYPFGKEYAIEVETRDLKRAELLLMGPRGLHPHAIPANLAAKLEAVHADHSLVSYADPNMSGPRHQPSHGIPKDLKAEVDLAHQDHSQVHFADPAVDGPRQHAAFEHHLPAAHN